MTSPNAIKKGIKQYLVADRYNLNKLVNHETRKEYQIDVANGFSALEGIELSIEDDNLVKIRDSIKSYAKEKVGILKTNRSKSWFDEECSELANKENRQDYFGNKILTTKLQKILVMLGAIPVECSERSLEDKSVWTE